METNLPSHFKSNLNEKPLMKFVSGADLMPVPYQIHTYSELKQQIHDDLRIQHPDWVGPNGESPMCDSYESRLIELLDTLPRRGSNESIAAPQRALEQGTGSSRLMEYDYVTGKDSQGENS